MKIAKNRKKEMVDEHLLHIVKNTTSFQRLVWLKKSIDFWKKMETRRQGAITK
jgi:hypothetical protein